MAKRKRRKKAQPVAIGGIQLPPAMLRGIRDFLNTPLGQALLAEMLIATAHALARRHPVAAAEAAAAETASGVKSFGVNASEAAVKFLHIAADLLKSGKHATKRAVKDASAGHRTSGAADTGNGAGSLWDGFDEETIRRALVAALGQGKAATKKKTSKAQRAA
jgi:hypothetical protein